MKIRMGTVDSDLISQVGYSNTANVMRVKYTDGTVFDYDAVPFSTFRALVRSKRSIGKQWLALRLQYKYKKL